MTKDEIHLDEGDEAIIIGAKEWQDFKTTSSQKCPICWNKDWSLVLSFGSGLGTNIEIMCRHCGNIIDVTDYDAW